MNYVLIWNLKRYNAICTGRGMYVIGKMYFICEITDKSPNLSIIEYYNMMRLN